MIISFEPGRSLACTFDVEQALLRLRLRGALRSLRLFGIHYFDWLILIWIDAHLSVVGVNHRVPASRYPGDVSECVTATGCLVVEFVFKVWFDLVLFCSKRYRSKSRRNGFRKM